MRVGDFGIVTFQMAVQTQHVDGCAEYTKTNDTCKTRPQGLDDHVSEIRPVSRTDPSLTSCYPTSSRLETEPQCHHRLPIPQRIVIR